MTPPAVWPPWPPSSQDLLHVTSIQLHTHTPPAVLAAPGVPTPASFAFFGLASIRNATAIHEAHVHGLEDQANGFVAFFELYRLVGTPPPVLIATATLAAGGGDYNTATFVFASDALRILPAGCYLMCQATTDTTGSPYNGYTVDFHFD